MRIEKRGLHKAGDIYGYLTLTGKSYQLKKTNGSRKIVEYICKCGKVGWSRFDAIKSGHTTSCGCAHIESITTNSISRHPLNNVWGGMIRRCYDETCEYYHNYGGRGVVVCEEWRNDIMSFFNWAINNGWEKGLELDKDKLSPTKIGTMYSPEYCCFITHKENSLYTSKSNIIEYKGVKKNLSVWCNEFGLDYSRIHQRISRDGWEPKKAFETPIIISKQNKKYKNVIPSGSL